MDIYKNYNIYELRELGRQKGVRLPTTYRKKDLIEEIKKIDMGLVEPYFPKTKQGRPTLSVNKVSDEKLKMREESVQKIYEDFARLLIHLKNISEKINAELTDCINIFSKEE